MLRFVQFGVMCVLLTTANLGCGSGKDLPPATKTPEINQAEVQKQMDESKKKAMEYGRAPGGAVPGTPPGAPPSGS